MRDLFKMIVGVGVHQGSVLFNVIEALDSSVEIALGSYFTLTIS